jgi:hypothetical protein
MRSRFAPLFVLLLLCAMVMGAQTPSLGAAKKKDEPKKPESQEGKKPESSEDKKPESGEAKKPESPKDKPFDVIVKDAKVIKGLFTLYNTEEKTYLEILPDQFDRMYVLSLTCDSGIGEGGLYADAMCGETLIMFHKQAKNVQLIAKTPGSGHRKARPWAGPLPVRSVIRFWDRPRWRVCRIPTGRACSSTWADSC